MSRMPIVAVVAALIILTAGRAVLIKEIGDP
jgi:hypothetical protein